jgi:hypothetical protein
MGVLEQPVVRRVVAEQVEIEVRAAPRAARAAAPQLVVAAEQRVVELLGAAALELLQPHVHPGVVEPRQRCLHALVAHHPNSGRAVDPRRLEERAVGTARVCEDPPLEYPHERVLAVGEQPGHGAPAVLGAEAPAQMRPERREEAAVGPELLQHADQAATPITRPCRAAPAASA